MTVDWVRAVLATHQARLQDMGVRSLSVFGSVARGEADATSDVDLLVDLDENKDLFEFIAVKHYLEDALCRRVDLVEARALKETVRDHVLREAVRAT